MFPFLVLEMRASMVQFLFRVFWEQGKRGKRNKKNIHWNHIGYDSHFVKDRFILVVQCHNVRYIFCSYVTKESYQASFIIVAIAVAAAVVVVGTGAWIDFGPVAFSKQCMYIPYNVSIPSHVGTYTTSPNVFLPSSFVLSFSLQTGRRRSRKIERVFSSCQEFKPFLYAQLYIQPFSLSLFPSFLRNSSCVDFPRRKIDGGLRNWKGAVFPLRSRVKVEFRRTYHIQACYVAEDIVIFSLRR